MEEDLDGLIRRMRGPSSWRPPLAGQDLRQAALTAVDSIAADLRTLLRPPQPSESAWDLASAALFLSYLFQAKGETADAMAAQTMLETAIDLVGGAERLQMSLHRGAAGLAWILHHSTKLLGIEGAEDATQSLDEELLGYLQGPGNIDEPYDLLDGLLGLGVYGFESGNRPLVERVVRRLAARDQAAAEDLARQAYPESGGRSWFTHGHCNLGLAHGVAGLIAFLAGAMELGIESDTARPLLLDSVQWLRRQRLSDGGPRAFPWAAVVPGLQPVTQGADPGWAYADSGIAAALAHAARALSDTDLLQEAILVAEREAARMHEVPARNPGIGFGPAGYAQIFARLYRQTGRPLFRRTASLEIHRLLEMRAPGMGVGGFFSVNLEGRPRDQDLGLLGGASGIGLVLLGAATGVDPLWDRFFLLSPLRLAP